VAISLLRRSIHIGLLEESSEPIGGDLVCPNCGHVTARHTFCGHCGIALEALPKIPGLSIRPAPRPTVRSSRHRRRLGRGVWAEDRRGKPSTGGLARWILHAFLLLFLFLIGIAFVPTLLAAPVVIAPCSSGQPCGAPPSVPPVVRATVWTSSRYGFSLDYPTSVATISQQTPSGVVLATDVEGNCGALTIEGFPARTAPATAISDQFSALKGVSQLAPDGNPAHQLLGAGVGYLSGVGRVDVGDLTSPLGSQPASVVSEAASNGHITVSATLVGATSASGSRSAVTPWPT
jgi:hypothetical protein